MHLLTRLLRIATRTKVVSCFKQFDQTTQNKLLCKVKSNNLLLARLCHSDGDESYYDEEYEKDLQQAENELKDDEFENMYKEFLELGRTDAHKVMIIQPYIKWGRGKMTMSSPQMQLDEAESLINTLHGWTVCDKVLVPLVKISKSVVFGKGKLAELRSRAIDSCSAVFVSLDILKIHQIEELQKVFQMPVYDRYSIVIHIFRAHATSPEAKLQVALAEIPYIWKKLNEYNPDKMSLGGQIKFKESREVILDTRKKKVQAAIEKLKVHRALTRTNRRKLQLPSIAIVGYTNAGKTSLIKALTGDKRCIPRNELFATLDTTLHEGLLPCRQKVLYVDTIGFIQNVPELLIEPFKVTLEDAIIADLIVHIYDASHPDQKAQVQHVQDTIRPMIGEDRPVINVANKCDLVEAGTIPEDVIGISATELTGIDLLREIIEEKIIEITGRKVTKIRVLYGSPEFQWFYKEATVIDIVPDEKNSQYAIMRVIVSPMQIINFKKYLKQRQRGF